MNRLSSRVLSSLARTRYSCSCIVSLTCINMSGSTLPRAVPFVTVWRRPVVLCVCGHDCLAHFCQQTALYAYLVVCEIIV